MDRVARESVPYSAATAFSQRLDRAMRNEADVVRKEHVRTALKFATAPLTITIAVAIASAVLLIVWSPPFVETRRGDICLGRIAFWSAMVGIATFTAPMAVRALRSRRAGVTASEKSVSAGAFGFEADDFEE